MMNFKKRSLLTVAMSALFVGTISCGGADATTGTKDVNPTTGCISNTTQAACINATGCTWNGTACAATVVTLPTPTTSKIYRLTKQSDAIVGTSADETFDATYDQDNFANGATLNAGDSVDGGGGTDTLLLQMAANITPSSLKNLEIFSVEATGGTPTLDLSNSDDKITTIKHVNAAAPLVVNNIPSVVKNFEMNSSATNNFTATVVTSLLTGTNDETTLTLNNVGAATVAIGPVAAGSGYETVNVVSSGNSRNGGAAGVVTLGVGNGNSLTTVKGSGVQDLGLTLGASANTVTTADFSAATGAVTFTAAANNGQNMTIKGGAGADIIDPQGYTTNDTIDCGAGVEDRLVLTAAQGAATIVQSNVTNCEVIGLSDGVTATTYTLSNFGATGLRFGANTAGAATVVYPAGTGTLDLQTFTGAGGALTVNHAGSGTSDIINMTIGSTTAGNTFAAAITFGGVETLNILSQGAANSIAGLTLPTSAGTQTVKVTGNQDLSLITVATTADILDASGMTGSGRLLMGTTALAIGAGTNAIAITGTANDDRLIGSTLADVIVGGAGVDNIANMITGLAAAAVTVGDSITTGAGFDTVTLIGSSASATHYNGCPVVTDFTVGTTATTTDLLRLSGVDTDYNNLALTTMAGADISTAAVTIQNVAQNASAAAGGTATLMKLTTPVAFTTDLQGTFNTAIGTATLTATGASTNKAWVLYDTTNLRMVIGVVLNTATTNTVIETGDAVRCIGTVPMTEAEYALIDADNFAAHFNG